MTSATNKPHMSTQANGLSDPLIDPLLELREDVSEARAELAESVEQTVEDAKALASAKVASAKGKLNEKVHERLDDIALVPAPVAEQAKLAAQAYKKQIVAGVGAVAGFFLVRHNHRTRRGLKADLKTARLEIKTAHKAQRAAEKAASKA